MNKKELFGEPNWKRHGYPSKEGVLKILLRLNRGEIEDVKPPKRKRGRPRKNT